MLKKIILGIVRFVLFFIIAVVILFLMWILFWTVVYNQWHKEIQQELDRTCGVNVVLESAGTLIDDPGLFWRNARGARCNRSSGPHEWECTCGDTSP